MSERRVCSVLAHVDPEVLSMFGNETCLHGCNDYIGNIDAVCDGTFHWQSHTPVAWNQLVDRRS